MTLELILQLAVLLAAIALGARSGGIGMGLWGGLGLFVLVFVFRAAPGAIPGEVLLIILTVIMAASAMEAAGGIDFLVTVAARIIRKSPRHVTIIAPVVAYVFTFLAGTGHVFYPLLPVIYEVAMKGRVRPERPIAVATIASQQAITASPVSAATAAMIAVLATHGIGLAQILAICVPSTLIGVIVAALVQNRVGVELDADPEYQRRLASGELTEVPKAAVDDATADADLKRKHPRAALSAYMFLGGVALVVLCGLFPAIRAVPAPVPTAPAAKVATVPATAATTVTAAPAAAHKPAPPEPAVNETDREVVLPKPIVVSMPMTIAIVMLALAALMLVFTGAPPGEILRTKTAQAGLTAVIGILGLAWLGDTFIADNKDVIIGGLSDMARAYPATFAIGLFVTSMLLFSQAATAKTLMPLGLSLGIPPAALAGMFPAVNGYFFIPTYGTLIAAVNFDRSGTTRIGKYVLNHSFMLPGIVSTAVAVTTGLAIGKVFF
ncbi:MAG: anaerobic C4-dicarboxylate transporter family protein [Phycisphaerae bacterium]|nr:anaerobic C4-dicarboxylate transporter family protein [Tepidisphaeraceae bacterium]